MKKMRRIDNLINQGKLDKAITDLECKLASCRSYRFGSLIGSNFLNDPIKIAEQIDEFISICEENFEVILLGMMSMSRSPMSITWLND